MLVRGQNHCCCKPPKQCEQEIPLNEYSRFSFDAKEKEYENFGVSFDNGTSSVELAGQGSYTVRVTDNPKNIFVRAHILELNAGAGGITIRRPDSDQSISLWWMGGTSYELRQGTTVLESITHTAASQDLKLELTTPRDATTDVLVYIDATLVHTEVGVAFVMPDVLHLGMVVEGPTPMGGEIRFGYLAVSPCLASTCEPYDQFCYADPWTSTPLTVPKMWHVNIPWPSDHGSNSWPDPLTDCTLPGLDVLYPQDIYFKLGTDVVYYDHDGEGAWVTVGGCGHVPFTPSKITYSSQYSATIETPYSLPPIPEGKFPMEYVGFCYWDGSTTVFPHANDKFDDAFTSWTYGSWQLFPEFRNVGTPESPDVEYRIRVGFYDSGTIEYVSDWMPHTGEVIDSSITLSISTNTSMYTGWDSSVSLQPNGGSKEFARRAMGCGEETCTPPVTPQLGTCYIVDITMVDDNGASWRWIAPTGAGFNEETGGWEWTGIGYANYVHDDCGALPPFDVKIHCVELEEGAEKQWVMDITTDDGTSRLTFEWFDEPAGIPGWTGTTNLMCTGEVWDVYAIGPNISSNPAYTFGSCSWDACSTPTGLVFGGSIGVSCYNNISDPPLTAYGYLLFTQTDSLPVGVSPGSVNGMAYRAILPSNLTGGDASSVFLFVQSGSAMVYIVDANLNLVADMFATIGYSCDPNDGKAALDDTSPIPYYWGSPNPQLTDPFGLCSAGDGNGDWSITFW